MVKSIDLSRNNITVIAQDNFKGQEHLDELDLSSNKISGLTSWVFDNLKVNYDHLFPFSHIHKSLKCVMKILVLSRVLADKRDIEECGGKSWINLCSPIPL